MNRIVWVLGSGFSVPLGGPTLADLFTPEAYHTLKERYPSGSAEPASLSAHNTWLGQPAIVARRLFLYGTRFERGSFLGIDKSATGERLWTDAEAYLDALETAALEPDGPLSRRLASIVATFKPTKPISPEILRNAGRRMLAVECSDFLRGVSTKGERWQPYRALAKRFFQDQEKSRHTVVSFNYDLVPELLGLVGSVVMPDHTDFTPADPYPNVRVLKLHGSVDWRVADGAVVRSTDENFVTTCPGGELGIAPPGPSKELLAERYRLLWKEAVEALRSAAAVVFLGYRFPESDAAARSTLLSALHGRSPMIHVILGSDTSSPHVQRMQGLLKFQSGSRVVVHPLWAQDFLSVLGDRSLNDPNEWHGLF